MQRLVQRGRGRGAREMALDVGAAVVGTDPGRRDGRRILRVVAVEECARVIGHRVRGGGQLRVPVVAGEHLVGALAALHHLEVLRYFARQQVEGDVVVAHHRLGHRRDGVGQCLQHVGGRDADLVVPGAELLGHDVRVLELVAGFPADRLEADRKSFQTRLPQLGEQRHDQARIDAAREQHADRHVGDHAALDGSAQRGFNHRFAFRGRQRGQRDVRAHWQRPVDAVAAGTIRREGGNRRRRQLAHAGQDCVRRRHHGVPAHVMMQRDRIDVGVDVTAGQQRRQGGSEAQPAGAFRQVQRLDAEAVARQRQPAGIAFDDGEGEHAVEALHAVRTPGVEGLEDDFRVAFREESVAESLQFLPQLAVVVDAAVEHDGQAELGIGHRLLRVLGEIDDAQAAVGKGDTALLPDTCGIGATRREGVTHVGDGIDIGG